MAILLPLIAINTINISWRLNGHELTSGAHELANERGLDWNISGAMAKFRLIACADSVEDTLAMGDLCKGATDLYVHDWLAFCHLLHANQTRDNIIYWDRRPRQINQIFAVCPSSVPSRCQSVGRRGGNRCVEGDLLTFAN